MRSFISKNFSNLLGKQYIGKPINSFQKKRKIKN
jgi:hypothetical protein